MLGAVVSLVCLLLLHQAHEVSASAGTDELTGGGSAGATSALLFELPAATDFYANEGNAYFDPYQILFSQTIKVTSLVQIYRQTELQTMLIRCAWQLMSTRDRTYWGVGQSRSVARR